MIKFRFSIFVCFICAVASVLLFSCSQQKIVEEHFQTHGMAYPVDMSRVTVMNVRYVGIEEEELLAPGVLDHIEKGTIFVKDYFQLKNIETFVPGAKAIAVSKPVLYKDESDRIGLMVKVTAYGEGKAVREVRGTIRWIGSDKQLWRVENFAYFSRNASLMWHYEGMVY